tara:strand:- start:2280 stop:2882 length:603 start_codon:yes stop_codon:yes gene_type:complete
MPTPAEVWLQFKPKLAEAREQDRAQIALSFLPILIPLGRFQIAPLTIERLLWLEQIESPFVHGYEPSREDVLAFLWVNSPDFRVGAWHGKKFIWNNYLIDWRKYAQLIAEYMTEIAAEIGGGENNAKQPEPNWLPQMIDAFASQYHWSMEEIMKMPVQRAMVLSSAMADRVSEKSNPSFSPNADRVRGEMMTELKKAEQA